MTIRDGCHFFVASFRLSVFGLGAGNLLFAIVLTTLWAVATNAQHSPNTYENKSLVR